MPIGLADLLRIRQELGFFGAGGGQRSEGEQIGSALSGLGSGLNSAAQGIGSGLDTFGKAMAIRKAQAEQRPVGSYFGVPSLQDESSLRQLFAQNQATRVPENIFPQQPLPEGAQGPMPSSVPQPAEQLTPPPDLRGQFQKRFGGMSPDVPSFMVPEMSKMAILGRSPEVLPVSALPQDARTRALAAGFQEEGMIDLKKFNALKTTDPYAPVSTHTPQAALDAETIQGNARVIAPRGQGIGNLSPGQQSALFKLNDDFRVDSTDFVKKRNAYNNVISSRRGADESGGGASDLALIYAFTKLQDPTMVTEQEIQNARRTGNLPEQLMAAFQQYETGGKLLPEMRDNLVAVAKRIYDESLAQQKDLSSQYDVKFKVLGIPPELYPINYEAMDSRKQANMNQPNSTPSSQPTISGSPKPGGVMHQDAQGNKAWVYPDGTFDEVR